MARAYAGRIPAGSNPNPSGVPNSGTLGGSAMGRPGRPQLMLGDEMYLWIMVVIEALLIGSLRKRFRRHHGG